MTSPLREGDPTRLGPYDIEARIGEGGQGTVYLGRGPDGVQVAVKILNAESVGDTQHRARFAREVRTAQRVAPFCTAALLDADLDAEIPYIVTEYVAGPSLREAVDDDGVREGAALDRLAIATATALVAIHQAGVVHHDFKPANVLLGPDGPRVIDFGIARATDFTATQSRMGTPAYMAPEQIKSGESKPKVDVFAWACVIAFAARGAPPFEGANVMAVLDQILNAQPELDGVPEKLRPLLETCLSKDPESRPDAVQLLGMLLGNDPAAMAGQETTGVMEQGYTVATSALPLVAMVPDPQTAPFAPAPTERIPEESAAPPPSPPAGPPAYGPPAQVPPDRGRHTRRPRSPWAVAALLAVLVIGGIGGWLALNYFEEGGNTVRPTGDTVSVEPSPSETVGDDAPAESEDTDGGYVEEPEVTEQDQQTGETGGHESTEPSPWATDDPTGQPAEEATPPDGEPQSTDEPLSAGEDG